MPAEGQQYCPIGGHVELVHAYTMPILMTSKETPDTAWNQKNIPDDKSVSDMAIDEDGP